MNAAAPAKRESLESSNFRAFSRHNKSAPELRPDLPSPPLCLLSASSASSSPLFSVSSAVHAFLNIGVEILSDVDLDVCIGIGIGIGIGIAIGTSPATSVLSLLSPFLLSLPSLPSLSPFPLSLPPPLSLSSLSSLHSLLSIGATSTSTPEQSQRSIGRARCSSTLSALSSACPLSPSTFTADRAFAHGRENEPLQAGRRRGERVHAD